MYGLGPRPSTVRRRRGSPAAGSANSGGVGATVADDARVGAVSRACAPGGWSARGPIVGNFVELKNAVLGRRSQGQPPDLSGRRHRRSGRQYRGAGTITCNYDGFLKHRTEIGAGGVHRLEQCAGRPSGVWATRANVGAAAWSGRDVPDDGLRGQPGRDHGSGRRRRPLSGAAEGAEGPARGRPGRTDPGRA